VIDRVQREMGQAARSRARARVAVDSPRGSSSGQMGGLVSRESRVSGATGMFATVGGMVRVVCVWPSVPRTARS
jgi:hypothetical protein